MKKFIVFLCVFSSSAFAVISEGQQQLRVSHSKASGDDIFVGDKELSIKEATAGGFDKYDIDSTTISSSWGVLNGGQVDLGLIYSHVDVGTREFGGISQVSGHYRHSLYQTDSFHLEGGLGFRSPGNDRSGDRFDSYNDGQIKYDYNLDFDYSPIQWLSLSLSNRFTDRASAGAKSQRLHELGASFQVHEKAYVRPFYQMFRTRDGRDISDADFAGRFSEVKENWNAFGLTVGYQVSDTFGIDLSYFEKLTSSAENTNIVKGTVLGLNYSL